MAGFTVPAGETWCFDPSASTTIESSANVVVYGTFRLRPASPQVVHTLRFVGVNESAFVGGGDAVLASDIGLWVAGAGKLDIAGAPKTAWLRAKGSIAAGDATVALGSAPSGWAPGDEVVVTATLPPTVKYHYLMDDLRTVQAVSSATVSLGSAMEFAHPAVQVSPTSTMTAEVANLTRNVRIEGTATGRSHIWIKSSQPQSISNTAIRHMGPRNGQEGEDGQVLGRYALHLHKSLDGARGSLVGGVVLRDIANNGFVAHDSHGVTFRANVVHDIIGEAFWWDKPTGTATEPIFAESHDTLIEGNLVNRVRSIPDYRGYTIAAYVAAPGLRNVMRGNVASGVAGNVNSSGFKWREKEGDTGVWVFEDNVSHNNKVAGIFTWQVTTTVHPITRLTAYHNGDVGIFSGAYKHNYHFMDSVLYGNGGSIHGTQFLAWAPSGGGAAGNRQKIQGLRIDAAGRTPYALTLAGRAVVDLDDEGPQTPGQVTGNTFRGYTGAAVKVTFDFHDFGPYRSQWQLAGNDYGAGTPFWFTDDIHENSSVSASDRGSPFTLRRSDQAGSYVTAWNARMSP